MAHKKYQDLDLTDAFLFASAMEDPETCQIVLELILGRSIGPVQVQVERSFLFSKDYRYVRFDVFAKDTTEVSYDVEMQNSHKEELPKRARYHQAEMDAVCLQPGQDFTDLPDCFVVFICSFDPFSSQLYRYTYEEICRETGEALGDRTCKIFLSTKGTNEADVPRELVDFLKYVEDSTDSCAAKTKNVQIKRLNQKLTSLKKSRRLEERYMTLQEMLDDQRAEGKAEGSQRILSLVARMLQDGLSEDIARLNTDEPFLRSMLEKYHIE
ncbi:MAG: Rpn family recombination-promoting nuclease/putative transposase [Lachnospiraceae bacterium]|nr:Rpn family recombination-promoting nuclease/putative transposase [Lachnospiraceae bacterium]